MFCGKCGEEIKEGIRFCGGCGAPVDNVNSAAISSITQQSHNTNDQAAIRPNPKLQPTITLASPTVPQHITAYQKKSNDGELPVIILSIILLICIFSIPMFDVWHGIIPGDSATTFGDVIHYISQAGEDAFDLWAVQLVMAAFIPAIFLFIGALARSKVMTAISSAIGAVWIISILSAIINQYGSYAVFDMEYCSVSIGTHIALALHVVCFICSFFIKKTKMRSQPVYALNQEINTNMGNNANIFNGNNTVAHTNVYQESANAQSSGDNISKLE